MTPASFRWGRPGKPARSPKWCVIWPGCYQRSLSDTKFDKMAAPIFSVRASDEWDRGNQDYDDDAGNCDLVARCHPHFPVETTLARR